MGINTSKQYCPRDLALNKFLEELRNIFDIFHDANKGNRQIDSKISSDIQILHKINFASDLFPSSLRSLDLKKLTSLAEQLEEEHSNQALRIINDMEHFEQRWNELGKYDNITKEAQRKYEFHALEDTLVLFFNKLEKYCKVPLHQRGAGQHKKRKSRKNKKAKHVKKKVIK